MKTDMIFKAVRETAKKNAAKILSGGSIIGVVGTSVLTGIGSWKACKKIERIKQETGKEKLTFKEAFLAVWPFYISPAVAGVSTIAGIVAADKIYTKHEASLVAACSLAETAVEDFKKKAEEVVGEKKVTEIKDAVAKEQLARNPVPSNEVVFIPGSGETLCFDPLSGRYFKNTIDGLRKIENEMNRMMVQGEDYVSLNEYYYFINLEPIDLGYELGWNLNRDKFVKIVFSSQIASNNQPCVVVGFENPPKYGFESSDW